MTWFKFWKEPHIKSREMVDISKYVSTEKKVPLRTLLNYGIKPNEIEAEVWNASVKEAQNLVEKHIDKGPTWDEVHHPKHAFAMKSAYIMVAIIATAVIGISGVELFIFTFKELNKRSQMNEEANAALDRITYACPGIFSIGQNGSCTLVPYKECEAVDCSIYLEEFYNCTSNYAIWDTTELFRSVNNTIIKIGTYSKECALSIPTRGKICAPEDYAVIEDKCATRVELGFTFAASVILTDIAILLPFFLYKYLENKRTKDILSSPEELLYVMKEELEAIDDLGLENNLEVESSEQNTIRSIRRKLGTMIFHPIQVQSENVREEKLVSYTLNECKEPQQYATLGS